MAATADDVGEVCVVVVWLFVVAHITKLGVVILMWVARKYCAYSSPLCEETFGQDAQTHSHCNVTLILWLIPVKNANTLTGE